MINWLTGAMWVHMSQLKLVQTRLSKHKTITQNEAYSARIQCQFMVAYLSSHELFYFQKRPWNSCGEIWLWFWNSAQNDLLRSPMVMKLSNFNIQNMFAKIFLLTCKIIENVICTKYTGYTTEKFHFCNFA